MKVSIEINNQKGHEINPFIYGNFMEFIERHISGMWAEMLENRRFSDYLPEKSIPEFWKPYGYNSKVEYSFDTGINQNTKCLRVGCISDNGGYAGLSQKGLAVKKNFSYEGYVYLKQVGLREPVEILIGRDYGVYFTPYAKIKIPHVTDEWEKYSFTLYSDSEDNDATFTVRFGGRGVLWVDHPSLMPEDNIFGWRKDVVEYIKKLKPNIIRFPGGCFADTYHWEHAIGNRDLRIPQDNYFWSNVPLDFMESQKRTVRHRRLIEPNDVGIDEFVQLCRITKTEPLICINMGSGTPEEAGAWVEYCNGGSDTEYGKIRVQNGYKEPYKIKYWEIGNEMFGSHEVGYSGLEGYIKGYKKFYKAMKLKDPNISLIINGHDREWNRKILQKLGGMFDYIDIHCYPNWTVDPGKVCIEEVFKNILTRSNVVEKQITDLREDISKEGLTGKVKIGVCEYNITGGGWGPTRAYMATQAVALFNASLIHIFQRNADIVRIANFSNLTNAWWASCIRTNNISSHTTTCFNVLSMFSNTAGNVLLKSSVKSNSPGTYAGTRLGKENDATGTDNVIKQDDTIGGNPILDIVSTFDEEDNAIVVSIINKSSREDIEIGITVNGFKLSGTVEVTSVSTQTMMEMNDFTFPDRVKPLVEQFKANILNSCNIKPCSLTMLKIELEE